MKNIGVVITDGVGYRNFVLSDFLKECENNFHEVIVYSCLPKTVYKNMPRNITIIELSVFTESFYTWFFRKFKEVAHLKLHKKSNFGIKDGFNTNKSNSLSNRGIATIVIYFLVNFLYSEKWIQLCNKWQQATFKNHQVTREYENLLSKSTLDYLFFTHQRPPYVAPLIYAAKKIKLKTGTFIFSWDNLASKGRMAGDFDTYLVWSTLMKNELLEFYRRVKENQIKIVGTPQFEPYVLKDYGYDEIDLIKKFDLDKEIKTILFTCNDSSSENDPWYLEILAEAIKKNELVEKVNLIVRTSPAEDPVRFESIATKYKFIKWNYPKWSLVRSNHQESWSQRVPSREDVSDLKMLLKHCDLCINVLSTITLDAFIFDKPVINPVFGTKENNLFNDQKFLEYIHLSRLVDSKSTNVVTNKYDYLSAINDILKGGDNKKTERKMFLKLQTEYELPGTSKRIIEAIKAF